MLQVTEWHFSLSHLKGAYDDLLDIINCDKLSTEVEKEPGWWQLLQWVGCGLDVWRTISQFPGWAKENLLMKKKNTWSGTTDSRYFGYCSSWILKENSSISVFQNAKVCVKCWGIQCNLMLNGSVRTLKWCKNCSNPVFQLGETVI